MEESDICLKCFHKLKFYTNQSCMQCAEPIEGFISKSHKKCYRCTTHEYYFDKIYTAFYYNELISENIHKFKFFDQISYAKTYIEYLAPNIKDNFDLIIPVPLHYYKLISRRYNQAGILAKHLSEKLGIPVNHNTLIKIRNTTPQRLLDFKSRLTNLEGAFKITNLNIVKDKKILLIDDVVTTASTVNECCKILKENGAKYIAVASVARSIKD
ncbi:MAG: ComF family protein [Alphaproteobacteria bacterium]|nr:ComF family protein [Alphaproteobacteria bacterium]